MTVTIPTDTVPTDTVPTDTLPTEALHDRRLPVGARFPRWTLGDELAHLTATPARRTVPVFPVGARFPRRAAAEVATAQAARVAAGPAAPVVRRPVGARFPRRWAA